MHIHEVREAPNVHPVNIHLDKLVSSDRAASGRRAHLMVSNNDYLLRQAQFDNISRLVTDRNFFNFLS